MSKRRRQPPPSPKPQKPSEDLAIIKIDLGGSDTEEETARIAAELEELRRQSMEPSTDFMQLIGRIGTRLAPEKKNVGLPLEPQTPGAKVVEHVSAIDAVDIAILRALAKSDPRLCSQYDLETIADVSRKTIGVRLKDLLSKKLVARPKGLRGGVTITAAGKDLLTKLDPRDTR
jgi:hypothetical protein